jgi:hypothetical protein
MLACFHVQVQYAGQLQLQSLQWSKGKHNTPKLNCYYQLQKAMLCHVNVTNMCSILSSLFSKYGEPHSIRRNNYYRAIVHLVFNILLNVTNFNKILQLKTSSNYYSSYILLTHLNHEQRFLGAVMRLLALFPDCKATIYQSLTENVLKSSQIFLRSELWLLSCVCIACSLILSRESLKNCNQQA